MYTCHFISAKNIVLCVIVPRFMGQFYVDNLRTLSICQQLAKKKTFVDSSVDRMPVDNSPNVNVHVDSMSIPEHVIKLEKTMTKLGRRQF